MIATLVDSVRRDVQHVTRSPLVERAANADLGFPPFAKVYLAVWLLVLTGFGLTLTGGVTIRNSRKVRPHMARPRNFRTIEKELQRLVKPFRVTNGKRFHLDDVNPGDTRGVKSKEQAREYLRHGVEALSDLQEKLYARNQWSVLLVFQAIDAAGKDGAIAHVMSGINPQGCQVYSFKSPSSEELDHDFLWRTTKALPERGRIGIFNRSYYEEVLVVRVHPEFLAAQKLPPRLGTKSIWKQRFESINDFEQHLVRNGTVVLKFFLHVSKREQKRRLLQRLDRPAKNWKFSIADVQEREYWNDYMRAYEDMIRHTAAEHAPWYVVPADNKWFTRLVVAWAIHGAMSRLRLAFPEVDVEKQRELKAVRRALRAQSTGQGARQRTRTRGTGR